MLSRASENLTALPASPRRAREAPNQRRQASGAGGQSLQIRHLRIPRERGLLRRVAAAVGWTSHLGAVPRPQRSKAREESAGKETGKRRDFQCSFKSEPSLFASNFQPAPDVLDGSADSAPWLKTVRPGVHNRQQRSQSICAAKAFTKRLLKAIIRGVAHSGRQCLAASIRFSASEESKRRE